MPLSVGNLSVTKHGIRCDRATPVGNPFEMRGEAERDLVIKGFRKYLYLVAMTWEDPEFAANKVAQQLGLKISKTWKPPQQEVVASELSKIQEQEDAVLLCWCAPKPCHCDIIINYLNYLKEEEWIAKNSCLIRI